MRKIITTSVLLATALLAAQDSPLPRYKVVRGYPRDNPPVVEGFNKAADQGYRLLFVSRVSVLRLDAAPPDTYRYAPLPEVGGLADFLNALDQQGALGYQWLEEKSILEKEPHPRNYEYRAVEGIKKSSRDRSRDSLLQQGFHLVGRPKALEIFIRELGTSQPAPRSDEVKVVQAARVGPLLKKMAVFSGQGYRYRSPASAGRAGGHAVSMERCDSACGGPFEYRSFDVSDSAQLERDLNVLGRDGFHVVSTSLAWPPHLMERPANHAQTFVYRVLEASDEQTTEQSLNQADRDGFVPLGFTSHVGWNFHLYLVLEKPTVSPAP